METGQIILTILLLIVVIALGFSYSDEVRHNRRLHGKLNYVLRRVKSIEDRAYMKLKEIEALEHTIALKDETIKNLNGDIAKLKFDYAVEVAGRNESKVLFDEVAETEETFECERCGGSMTADDQAAYNQFSQIDFSCCQSCADSGGGED